MPYRYEDQKPCLFTEEGQVMFLAIRDRVKRLIREAGAVRMEEAIAGQSGDNWDMLACIDRMVELEEIREVPRTLPVPGQHRIFVGVDR